jgi:gag-polypeptide of LTR copia-type
VINHEYLTWHRQDKLLLGWIHSYLTESIQTQVVSCATTADLWSTLLNTISFASRAQLIDLRRQLQTITKGSSSCSEYLQKIRKVADELGFIGSPVTDDDLILAVLTGLGPDYNSSPLL